MLPLQEVIIPAHDVNDAYFVSFPSKRLIFGGQGRALRFVVGNNVWEGRRLFV
jgi:hypothetical protein